MSTTSEEVRSASSRSAGPGTRVESIGDSCSRNSALCWARCFCPDRLSGAFLCLLHTSLKGNGYEDDEGLHCRAISGRDANGSCARADKSRCRSEEHTSELQSL